MLAHPAGGVEVAVDVLPLGHHVAVVQRLASHGQAVFGDHIHAKVGQQVGDVVVDHRVNVIGPAHQQDQRLVIGLGVLDQLGPQRFDLGFEFTLRRFCLAERLFDRPGRDAQAAQVLGAGLIE